MDGDIVKMEITSEIIKTDNKDDGDDHNGLKNVTREVQFEDENLPNEINNKNMNNEDVIEEDVPSDFFDDFMNNEFMEGLDVVDAWDEDEAKEEEKKPIDPVKRHQNVSFRKSKDNRRIAVSREHLDNRRDPEKTKRAIAKDKEKCAKDKEAKIISEKLRIVETGLVPPGMETEVDLKEIKKQEAKILLNDRISLKEGKEKPEHIHNFGREKPKLVMKDKMSNAIMIKDLREKLPAKKEIRVSSERKLLPGRNSRERRDILHRNSREHKNVLGKSMKNTIEKREILRHSRENRETFDKASRGKREVIVTPAHEIREPVARDRFRSKSKSSEARLRYYKRRLEEREARLSSEKRLRLRSRSRSYHRGKKSYSRSPRRHLNIAEERHRRRDSPPIRRKSRGGSHFKFSPSPVMSEREMWLRHKPRKLGSPPKEPHHVLGVERRTIGFLEELADKLKSDELKKSNLLNEIQKQLNEPSKHSFLSSRPHMHEPPMMVDFIPAPVPPPPQQNFYLPPPLQQQRPSESNLQFDEEFFIGQPAPFPDPNSSFEHNFSPYQSMPPQQYYNNPPPGNHLPSQPINFPIFENPNNVNLSPPVGEQQAIITQLFENKKISLSDYLKSISTKTGTDSAATIPIQKKVKVITLCQDVINSIGDDFEGRFFLKPWKKLKQQEDKINEDDKTRTPMKKLPAVRFNFTTKCKTGKERSYLYSTCNKLLATVGLEKTPPESPPYPPPSQKISPPVMLLKKPPTPIAKPENEPFKCHTCEIRKARQFTDSGSQCKSDMVSVGTQMSDEDLIRFGNKPTLKGILKNQSLAELTPAQLLSQSSMGNNSTGRMNQLHNSEQGFVMSPEKKFDFHPNRPMFQSASNFELMNKPMDINKPSQLMQLDLGQQYFDFDIPRNAFGDHIPQRQNNKKGKKRRGKFMQGLGPGAGPPKPYYNM